MTGDGVDPVPQRFEVGCAETVVPFAEPQEAGIIPIGVKVAETFLLVFITIVQSPVLVQVSDQPENFCPLAGDAVRVTLVPGKVLG